MASRAPDHDHRRRNDRNLKKREKCRWLNMADRSQSSSPTTTAVTVAATRRYLLFLDTANQSPFHGASIRIVRYGHLLILQKGKFSMFVDISDLVRRQLQTMRRCWRD